MDNWGLNIVYKVHKKGLSNECPCVCGSSWWESETKCDPKAVRESGRWKKTPSLLHEGPEPATRPCQGASVVQKQHASGQRTELSCSAPPQLESAQPGLRDVMCWGGGAGSGDIVHRRVALGISAIESVCCLTHAWGFLFLPDAWFWLKAYVMFKGPCSA